MQTTRMVVRAVLLTMLAATRGASVDSSVEATAGARPAPESLAPADAATPDRLEKIKHPLPWLSWNLDFRFREEYLENPLTLRSGSPDDRFNYQRYRTRLGAVLAPWPNVALDARLASEFRTYVEPESLRGVAWNEILFDHLNLQLTDLFQQPLALTLGRQDLAFGNRWLIHDGTTTDASRTEFFDSARLTCDWRDQQTVFDAIYFDQSADSERWLPPLYGKDLPLSEQDRRGVILYAANTALRRTRLEAFFIFLNEEQVLINGDTGDLYVFGARAEGELGDHWQYRAEFAPQLGTKNGRGLDAFGFNSRLSYLVRDSWNHSFRLSYEYLSGDDPDTSADEGWDPLWGRRAQWSELMMRTFAIENRLRSGEWSNLQRLGVGWSGHPWRSVELLADYLALFANQNPLRGQPGYSDDGRFRGHLFAGIVKFTFSQRVTGHLWSEFFLPGDYYAPDRRSLALFLRAELCLKL